MKAIVTIVSKAKAPGSTYVPISILKIIILSYKEHCLNSTAKMTHKTQGIFAAKLDSNLGLMTAFIRGYVASCSLYWIKELSIVLKHCV